MEKEEVEKSIRRTKRGQAGEGNQKRRAILEYLRLIFGGGETLVGKKPLN